MRRRIVTNFPIKFNGFPTSSVSHTRIWSSLSRTILWYCNVFGCEMSRKPGDTLMGTEYMLLLCFPFK